MNSCDKYATESNLTMNCCFSPHCSNDTRLGLMHLWGALKCGPKVLLQTGIGDSTPEKHLGVSQGTTALFCTQDALDGTWQQQPAAVLPPLSAPAGSETIGAFTPLRPTPGCTLRTGRPGWPAAAPWRAGRPPGPGASLWWSLSSARRPLLTPGRRWNFDRMELLSVPAGKTWSRGTKRIIYTMLVGKSTDVREGNTYRKHSSHDPSVVLSEGLSIRVVWTEEPTERLVYIQNCLEMSSCRHAYLVLPGCLAVPRWPVKGTPWGTWGLVGARAEPLWQNYEPGRRRSVLRAGQWTGAWGSPQDPTSVSGEFSTWCRDMVECCSQMYTSSAQTLSEILTTD